MGAHVTLSQVSFFSMRRARLLIEDRRIEHNTDRPHSSLDYLAPEQFARAHDATPQFL
ncbi:integrase core domain-containing protein [Paraburkholderia humisilvae]|uniref:integrase core domain-containing protein n=1 Tax=Paraburkholderia humisilvae TaxID=627669 RepID=UPI0036129B13